MFSISSGTENFAIFRSIIYYWKICRLCRRSWLHTGILLNSPWSFPWNPTIFFNSFFFQNLVNYIIRVIRFGLPSRAVAPFILGVCRLIWLGHLVPTQLQKLSHAGAELCSSGNIYLAQENNFDIPYDQCKFLKSNSGSCIGFCCKK